jgi:AraC-like DNA-binding protein
MYYQEHLPDMRLTPLIETYWSAGGFAEQQEPSKVLPDGCVDIIFSFDSATGGFCSDIFGTTTSFLEVSRPQSVQMFGIRFNPVGITAFTRIPVEEFTNRNIELALVKTLFDKSFYEPLPEKKSTDEIITHTNNYLIRQLSCLYCPDKQIIRAVDLISLAKGQLSLTGVASEVCLCPRHFERKFKSAIGLSPKTFAGVVRFKHALQHLRENPHKDLLSISVECGYYDHTHLIKDFKRLSGDTPAVFRQ